jgi:hypothetical protein
MIRRNSLETWHNVVLQLVGTAPFVAYDRSGLGESVWDAQLPTPGHVSGRLHRLLREIGADPPYVLVGHARSAAPTRRPGRCNPCCKAVPAAAWPPV